MDRSRKIFLVIIYSIVLVFCTYSIIKIRSFEENSSLGKVKLLGLESESITIDEFNHKRLVLFYAVGIISFLMNIYSIKQLMDSKPIKKKKKYKRK